MSEESADAGLFDTLTSLPRPEVYTDKDRWHDFRRVFMGSEEGKRVLREILAWGHMFRSSAGRGAPIDPCRLAFHEGERNLALRLLTTVTVEPPERPTETKRTKG